MIIKKQHKSKVYFHYGTGAVNSKIQDVQDFTTATSKLSASQSVYSTSSFRSGRRANEIEPKKKINISSSLKPNKIFEYNQSTSIQSFQPIQLNRKMKSIDYKQIKPLFNIKKYTTFFCGMESSYGINGCNCSYPCPWRQKWTQNNKPKNYKLFKNLPRQRIPQKQLQQIDKDLSRTHPECPTFHESYHFRDMLRQVLQSYCVYDEAVGYVQGMNMIAGTLLYHIKDTEQAFWALVDLMEDQELRMIYLSNFDVLKEHCRNIADILVTNVNDLFNHMKQLQIEGEVFLYGWLLSLMSVCIPLEFMHQVIDNFRKNGWNFIYKLVVTYLLFIKQSLLLADDAGEFLHRLNNNNSRELGIQWEEMIQSSKKLTINS